MNRCDYIEGCRGDARNIPPRATVFVVDDEASVRSMLESLITIAGLRARIFGSAEEFLAYPRVLSPSCLIVDLTLSDLNGLKLQQLVADRSEMPIIFIADYADVPMTVAAMKAGAVELLLKPVPGDTLLAAIETAINRSRAILRSDARKRALRQRYLSLSVREREVLDLVVEGRLNKQVGAALGIALITVKGYRSELMRKMGAASLPELVNMAVSLGLPAAQTNVKATSEEEIGSTGKVKARTRSSRQ